MENKKSSRSPTKAGNKKHATHLLKKQGVDATPAAVSAMCEAFPESVDDHGRVTVTPEMVDFVKKAVANTVLPSKETLQCCKLIVEIQKILFATEQEQGKHIPKADHENWVADTQSKIKMLLVKALKNELPPKLAGYSAVEIAAKMDGVIDELVWLIKFVRA